MKIIERERYENKKKDNIFVLKFDYDLGDYFYDSGKIGIYT